MGTVGGQGNEKHWRALGALLHRWAGTRSGRVQRRNFEWDSLSLAGSEQGDQEQEGEVSDSVSAANGMQKGNRREVRLYSILVSYRLLSAEDTHTDTQTRTQTLTPARTQCTHPVHAPSARTQCTHPVHAPSARTQCTHSVTRVPMHAWAQQT